MRTLYSLFISAILYRAYYYLHPSSAGCMNMIWHFCQLNAFSFFTYRTVRLRVAGCNVTRATRHMRSGARIVSRTDPKLRFQLLDTLDFEKFFAGASARGRVIRTRVNNARPSINFKLIYDDPDS